MDIQNIDISKITKSDLCNFTESELVYIYLATFKIPQSYSIDNIEHQKILHTDFLEYIKGVKFFLNKEKFIDECKWWWYLIPDKIELITDVSNILPVFSYYNKPIFNMKPRANINLLKLYQVIHNPKYFEKQTILLRNISDKAQSRDFKSNQFDYVTFSGIFPAYKRTKENCIKPSGYLCLDLDHVKTDINELKTKLINDTNLDVQFMFVSPNGDGLKPVLLYDTYKIVHDKFFELMEKYFALVYDFQIDKACKDICRPCFIPYDSEVYMNPKILKR